MKSCRNMLVILLLTVLCHIPLRLSAVDPMTMSSAAPQALELASIWSPHAINALQSVGTGMVNVGTSLVDIFRLPLGVIECTLGYPFGFAQDGVDNCWRGIKAPFELVIHVLILPVRIVSLGAVR